MTLEMNHLGPTQGKVLSALRGKHLPVTANQLAQELGITRIAVKDALRRLQNRRLAEVRTRSALAYVWVASDSFPVAEIS